MNTTYIAFAFLFMVVFVFSTLVAVKSKNILTKTVMFAIAMADSAFFTFITIATFFPSWIPV